MLWGLQDALMSVLNFRLAHVDAPEIEGLAGLCLAAGEAHLHRGERT